MIAGGRVRPLISVVMANHNGALFLEHAARSVLAQRGANLELVLIDDASTDGSVLVMQDIARRDARVRVLCLPRNMGPAAARNTGIDHAAGEWIAVVDSDDLLHPDRLAKLLDAAMADGADIAADDLLQFDEAGRGRPRAVLGWSTPRWIDLPAYIGANALFGHGTALGYLKPLFRVETTFGRGVRYNPALRISEDYDLVVRMMLDGARFKTYPYLTYFYRKHAGSISHRLPEAALRAMLQADEASLAARAANDGAVAEAVAFRRKSILRALAFTAIVHALKTRDYLRAAGVAARHPRAAVLLALPVKSMTARFLPARSRKPPTGRDICLISRQRVVGHTNGSSAYLLDLCRTMAGQGWRVHFVCPSPAIFGRWPVLRLQPEMDVFTSLRIRGGIRAGRFVFAADPRIGLAACVTLAARFGIGGRVPEKRAPYAIASPLLVQDRLYLARHGRRFGDIVLADYAFLTEGLAYVLRPEARTAVIMHDLFSSRTAQFASAGEADSVAVVSSDAEYAMLAQAGTVIAIQDCEAGRVRRHLPGKPVLTVAMSASISASAQPGLGASLLFVGGKAAPNVIGLNWFTREVWPRVLSVQPDARLSVIGDAGAASEHAPHMRLLGRVADLTPFYRDAAVVISPLPMGSGLKIKIVEAMAHGKAIVATPASLQGLPAGVIEAESAEAFAAAVIGLLGDVEERRQRGEEARAMAQALFSREVAHAALIGWLKGEERT